MTFAQLSTKKRQLLILLSILLIVWFFGLRRVYYAKGIWVWLHHSGPDFSVTFVIEDSKGDPAPDVRVSVDTTSGGEGSVLTDERGFAVLPVGEPEIVSVWIDGAEIELYHIPVLDQISYPDCSGGLIVAGSLPE